MGKWHRSYQDNYFSKKFILSNKSNFRIKKKVNLFKDDVRRVSTLECLRLQGFPDTFKIPVSTVQAYKQFGNSVPVNVIEEIASGMINYLEFTKRNTEVA